MTSTDWSSAGGRRGLRYLDYQTTVKALSDPADFHEVELPQALVDNHAGFAAFEVEHSGGQLLGLSRCWCAMDIAVWRAPDR